MLEFVKSLDYHRYYWKFTWERPSSLRLQADKRIEALFQLLSPMTSEPLCWTDFSLLDNYLGPWETYRQLVGNSEIGLGDQTKLNNRYTKTLIELTEHFSSDLIAPDQSESRMWSYTWFVRGSTGMHLGLSHRHLDVLSSRLLPLIKHGADVNGLPWAFRSVTPLQRILLFNLSDFRLQGFIDATKNISPDNEISKMCLACSIQKIISRPPVDEWLALLKSAGIDLCEYGEVELAIWNLVLILKAPPGFQIPDKPDRTICLRRDFGRPGLTPEGGRGLGLGVRHIGTLVRRVRFHIDPDSDWKFRLTWEDEWDTDELGQSICFCFDEHGQKREPMEIARATLTRWRELDAHKRKQASKTLEEKIESIPGSWKEERHGFSLGGNRLPKMDGHLKYNEEVCAGRIAGEVISFARPLP